MRNPTPVDNELDQKIEKMVDEYRSAVLLASHDLTNDKAISLVAYATISLRGKIKALATKEQTND